MFALRAAVSAEPTDQELVAACIRLGSKDPWNEFFTRFIKNMEKSISNTLRTAGDPDYLKDPENVVGEIHFEIVKKLLDEDLLSQCVDPSGIEPWLVVVARNQTFSWLRKKGRQKELIRRAVEGSLVSLDELIGVDSDFSLLDTVAGKSGMLLRGLGPEPYAIPGTVICDEPYSDIEKTYLKLFLPHLEKLKSSGNTVHRRKFWIMRLSLVSQFPFSEEETEEFTAFSALPYAIVRQKLADLDSKLAKAEVRRTAELGRAVLYLYEIRRLHAQLQDISGDDSKPADVLRKGLDSKITLYGKRRTQFLSRGEKMPRPSNAEIAELVGITPQQCRQVTVIRRRLREDLLKQLPPP